MGYYFFDRGDAQILILGLQCRVQQAIILFPNKLRWHWVDLLLSTFPPSPNAIFWGRLEYRICRFDCINGCSFTFSKCRTSYLPCGSTSSKVLLKSSSFFVAVEEQTNATLHALILEKDMLCVGY